MKFFLYSLLTGFFLLMIHGCTQNQSKNHINKEDIIEREKMIHLMADMEITESALKVQQVGMKRDSLKSLANSVYDSLYIYYQTTPDLFKQNLEYYQIDLENYQKMLDEKITILSQKKDSISSEPDPTDTVKVKPKK